MDPKFLQYWGHKKHRIVKRKFCLREADWFDFFFYPRYISKCEKQKIFTESLILAQDERWRHA